MKINIDCKYYIGSKPCKFHKSDKRLCENCDDYIKIQKRILIVKFEALGDVLRTTSILPALKKKYPDSHITWITKTEAGDLLRYNEFIDRLLTFENNYLSFVLSEEFDIGICLDAESKSAAILTLANCKEKLGFLNNKSGQLIPANKEAEKWYLMGLNDDMKKQNRVTYQNIIYKICRIEGDVYKPQINFDKNMFDYQNYFKKNNNLEDFKLIIGLNTGGGSRWECKSWIQEYYFELIKKLNDYDPKIKIILFGGEKERSLIENLKKENPGFFIDAECHDSVSKFAGIINLVDIFVTPDSLGFHIGIALNKYSIVLVGPTSPWELDVYGNGEILFNNDIDCIACYDTKCKKNKECMKSLTPEMIFGKIRYRINEVSNR